MGKPIRGGGVHPHTTRCGVTLGLKMRIRERRGQALTRSEKYFILLLNKFVIPINTELR
jgi:hypothetical protein